MMERPKFRRKRKPTAQQDTGNPEDDLRPVAPLETRAERLARRKAEDDAVLHAAQRAEKEQEAARQQAEDAARQKAKEAARREAEALARKKAEAAEARRQEQERARQQAEVDARRKAEEHEAREAAARKLAQEKERRHREALAKAEDSALKARAEAERIAAEKRQARLEAERLEAEALRAAEAEARRAEQAARRKAEAEARTRDAELRRQKDEADARSRRQAEDDERRAALEAQEAARKQAEERKRLETEQAEADADARRKAEAAEAARVKAAGREAARSRRANTQPPLPLTNALAAAPVTPRRPASATKAQPSPEETLRQTQPPMRLGPDAAWAALAEFPVDEDHLTANRIVTATREDPAHTAFDVLRTRLLQALSENGWKRVAITSPTKDCGKTFTAANLAISLSRQENCRTLLIDCDMRRPSLHKVLGVRAPGPIGDMLRGAVPPQDHLMRIGQNRIFAGRNIAFGFNSVIEPYASELLQDPRTSRTLDVIQAAYEPDVMLFDLPPALFYDDVIAFRPIFDGVLLVIGGGITTEKEVKEVERRLGDSTPLLGMVLNKAESTELKRYQY